jgi:hypothetical protein
MLVGREDLRDRFIKVVSAGRINLATQALDDAARRVMRYLLMQLVVNAIYGVPVGIGLFLIGVAQRSAVGTARDPAAVHPVSGSLDRRVLSRVTGHRRGPRLEHARLHTRTVPGDGTGQQQRHRGVALRRWNGHLQSRAAGGGGVLDRAVGPGRAGAVDALDRLSAGPGKTCAGTLVSEHAPRQRAGAGTTRAILPAYALDGFRRDAGSRHGLHQVAFTRGLLR